MVLMASRSLSSPSATIFCGVSATANSARVARLTPASVACADSTTATNSVKGLRCSSSPFGSGFARRNRLKASWTSPCVQGLGALSAFLIVRPGLDLPALGLSADAAGARFAGVLGEDRTMLFLARWGRMILAMFGGIVTYDDRRQAF